MNSFNDPREASSYVVGKILEQATAEGIELTQFERELMCGSVADDQVESFEDRNDGEDAEAFWSKIAQLIRLGIRKAKENGGRLEQREYEDALRVAATDTGYLAGIIQVEGFSTPTVTSRIEHGYRKWLLLVVVCVVGGLGLASILIFDPFGFLAFQSSATGQKLQDLFRRYGAVVFVVLAAVAYLTVVVGLFDRKQKNKPEEPL
jgi:hypothetical protein